jgi:hypothetical protein
MNDIRARRKGILASIKSKLINNFDLFWKKRVMTDLSKGNQHRM